MIIYQSAMIAPLINKLLTTQDVSFIWLLSHSFLVYCWKYYNTVFKSESKVLQRLFLLSFVLMLICFFAVPFMNDARDSGKQNLFFILHAGSMIFPLVINLLILEILIISASN